MFIMKNEETVPDAQRIYFEKFPAGHYELKIFCDHRSHGQVGFHALRNLSYQERCHHVSTSRLENCVGDREDWD